MPAFQAVQELEILQAFGVEIIGRQIGQVVGAARKNPLIRQVVNGEAHRGCVPPPFRARLMQDQSWHESGLPIVDMHDFRLPRQIARQMRHAFRKENKPLAVVRVIRAILLVKPARSKYAGW